MFGNSFLVNCKVLISVVHLLNVFFPPHVSSNNSHYCSLSRTDAVYCDKFSRFMHLDENTWFISYMGFYLCLQASQTLQKLLMSYALCLTFTFNSYVSSLSCLTSFPQLLSSNAQASHLFHLPLSTLFQSSCFAGSFCLIPLAYLELC